MGTKDRKEREKKSRCQQILSAANRIVSVKGFRETTIEDIAMEAELGPGTLYLYFRSKDEICAALFLRTLQYLNTILKIANSESISDGKQRVVILKDALYDVYQFDPLFVDKMMYLQSGKTLKKISPDLAADIKVLFHRISDTTAEVLGADMIDRMAVKFRPEVLTDVIWYILSGVILWERSKNILAYSEENLKRGLDITFEIFMRGIATRTGNRI